MDPDDRARWNRLILFTATLVLLLFVVLGWSACWYSLMENSLSFD